MTFDQDLLAAMRTVTPAAYAFPAKEPPKLYVTYQRVTGKRHSTLNSGAGAPRGDFQIDVWGETRAAVRVLADALQDTLPNLLKVGDMTDGPDDYEAATKLHRASFDVVLWK